MDPARRRDLLSRVLSPLRSHAPPAFLIVGAQKAGTSALFRMLAAHPRIAAPARKELHFFDDDEAYARGIRAYRRQFPATPPGILTFEATPSYLFIEPAAARIHRHLPDARIVIVLRDPVRRAYSAWNMFHGFDPGSGFMRLRDERGFAEAVDDELAGRPVPTAHRYLARGRYAPQLKRFHDLFGRDRVQVFAYPLMQRDPAAVANAILRAVDLPPFTGTEAVLMVRKNTRPYDAPLDPALEQRLREHFAPHLADLERELGAPIDLNESRP